MGFLTVRWTTEHENRIMVRTVRREAAPGEAGHPALALANSRSARGEDLATPAAVRLWLAAHGLPPDDRVDVAAMVALRDAVRELLLARIEGRRPAPSAVDAVNAAAAPTAPRLVWGDAPRVERAGSGAALIAADAIELVTAGHGDLLHCSAPGCVRLLIKDHPRRQWCSTRCGDRVRASRYYHRHRKGTAL
jgi:predicted RNA-binding Zn ribbon-like protein